MRKKLLWICYGLYSLAMLWLLFGQRLAGAMPADYWQQLRESVNLRPLATVQNFWWVLQNSHERGRMLHAFVNLVGNVAMFVPLGALLPDLWKSLRRPLRFWVVVLITLLTIELVQLVTLLGTFDVDDILLNTLGVLLGRLAWRILVKEPPKN